MTDTGYDATSPAAAPGREDGRDAHARIVALEAEVLALRGALADAGLVAERVAGLNASELAGEKAGRAADAGLARSAMSKAETRHGQQAAKGRADLVASEEALRRANASLAESRAVLLEREERILLLLGTWAQAVWETDAEGFVVADSPSWRACTGQSEREWLGYGWLDAVHPDDRADAERRWREAIAARQPVDAEFRLRCAAGGWRWTNLRATPLLGPDGAVAKWVGMSIDITELREAEARLRERERRLKATQDHAGVGIHEVDRHGRHVRLNETFTRISGYTLDDLAGRSIWDLIEDEADRRNSRDAFARLVRGEIESAVEQRPYTGRHGRRWWAEVTTTAVRDAPDAEHPKGRFLYAVRVVQDITERKQAEEQRALLLAEVNHRVKNTLAVVQSLAAQTARGATDLPSFSTAFQARLIALARAHDLLAVRHWESAALDAVVRAALDPLARDAARVDLSGQGSGVTLPPKTALALAMVLHELAANARRHGALSAPEGRVSVACRTTASADGSLVIGWVERGGPPVAGSPARRGFGLRLLASGLTAEAGVRGDIRFEPEGVHCILRLPSTRVVPGAATG